MAAGSAITLDPTDWRIVTILQRDGRIRYADLAREVGMSPRAVADRVRRLEEAGVIVGYAALVDPERVGLGILALIRVRYPTGNYAPFERLLATTPEIIEAHHVTGEDCFVLKVVARSMGHLEEVAGRASGLGGVATGAHDGWLKRRGRYVDRVGLYADPAGQAVVAWFAIPT